MSRTPFLLSSIALALLAGCAAEHSVTPAPAPVVVTPAPVVAAPAPGTPVVVQQPGTPAVVVQQPSAAASTVVVPPAPGPLRAGFGRVASITPIPVAAAGGGTVMSATRRIGLRMDDGSTQYVDTTASPLAVNDRVEITSDGKMRHPVQ
jgi:hypothetical protein